MVGPSIRLMRFSILSLFLLAAPVHATEVDLELVLLADASGSIDQSEIDLQRQGYAAAITHPDVLYAISSTLTGSIAVTYVEWAANQVVVADWAIITAPEDAQAFAARLLEPPRLASGRNAIGAALLEGKRLIEENDITGLRRVIDFSGDSANNWSGPSIEEARAEVLAAGITINALPLMRSPADGWDSPLVQIYEDRIIGGPGAFLVPADTGARFTEAVRRKLILEIAGSQPEAGAIPTAAPDSAP